jgi:hypothetical protein
LILASSEFFFWIRTMPEVVLAGCQRRIEVGGDRCQFAALAFEPRRNVFAAAHDRRRRALQLAVLLDHRVDRVLVGNLRVPFFHVGDPQRDEARPEVGQTPMKLISAIAFFLS